MGEPVIHRLAGRTNDHGRTARPDGTARPYGDQLIKLPISGELVFDTYTVLLMISGLLLIIVGAAVSGPSTGSRVLTVLAGVAFFGYGFYLEFLFTGGTYRIFFYAFVVPVLVTYRAIMAHRAKREGTRLAQQAPAFAAGQPVEPGLAGKADPYGYGQPAQADPTGQPGPAQSGAGR